MSNSAIAVRFRELTPRLPLLVREGASRSEGGELQKAACYQQVEDQARRILWVIMILVLCGSLFGQTHFQPVDTTGLPYIIVITEVDVFGGALATGDEIAVFDGELCVGAGVFDGQYNYQFTAWEKNEDYGLSGFTPGDSMTFRIWTMVNMQWEELPCVAEIEAGDGTFGYGAYTVVSLSTQSLGVKSDINLQPAPFHLEPPFPNPFNGKVTLKYHTAVRESAVLTIYTITGKEIYHTTIVGKGQFKWEGRTDSGISVSSGSYFATLKSQNQSVSRLFTILK